MCASACVQIGSFFAWYIQKREVELSNYINDCSNVYFPKKKQS